MKKTLIKTLTIAALLFSSNLASAKAKNTVIQHKKIQADQIIFSSNVNKSIHNYRIVPMYSMQTRENLKTYHAGHKFFNLDHKVPTEKDLLDNIRSCPFFIGTFANELSHEECISLKDKADSPFFIFETHQDDRSDFYMVHSKGNRHFIITDVGTQQYEMASFCNSSGKEYPSLESFIKCTLESHSDKYFA